MSSCLNLKSARSTKVRAAGHYMKREAEYKARVAAREAGGGDRRCDKRSGFQ